MFRAQHHLLCKFILMFCGFNYAQQKCRTKGFVCTVNVLKNSKCNPRVNTTCPNPWLSLYFTYRVGNYPEKAHGPIKYPSVMINQLRPRGGRSNGEAGHVDKPLKCNYSYGRLSALNSLFYLHLIQSTAHRLVINVITHMLVNQINARSHKDAKERTLTHSKDVIWSVLRLFSKWGRSLEWSRHLYTVRLAIKSRAVHPLVASIRLRVKVNQRENKWLGERGGAEKVNGWTRLGWIEATVEMKDG